MVKAGPDTGAARSYFSLLSQQAAPASGFQPPSRSNSSSGSGFNLLADSPRSGGGVSSSQIGAESGRRGARMVPSGERVRVVLRIRPTIKATETPGCLEVLPGGRGVKLYRHNAVVPETVYNFDKVLGPQSVQADVYEAAVAPVIADVMNGYNGTIMAYGQTGAGKTHTLSSIEPNNIGMMPRAAAEIFVQANNDPSHEYMVLMSYVQIYMELIQDLLRPESENLSIRENEGGVFISGVQEVQVKKMEDCLQLLQLGERNRAFAFTQLNAHSSRSHAIVMLTVIKRTRASTAPKGDGKVKVGKLFIVDLAGSERLKKSRSEGQRQREAKSINLSLTKLGMCINARADPTSAHVPFRDSKLTRLLQESLGGNAKTSLVLAVADVREHAEETQQSMQFGSRAMCVKTHPVINEHMEFSRAIHGQLVTAQDKQLTLEASLMAKTEEMSKLRRTMAKEQERNRAILEALEAEKAEMDEIRKREAQQLEAALAEKQAEVDRHVGEAEAARAEKEAALAQAAALAEEVAAAKAAREQHDSEIELLLRQWHAEKSAWSKATKAAAARAEEERAALLAEHEEEKEAFVLTWQGEVKALSAALAAARQRLRLPDEEEGQVGEAEEEAGSLEGIKAAADALTAGAEALTEALNAACAERDNLRAQLAQRDHAEGAEQQAKVKELRFEHEASRAEVAALQEKMDQVDQAARGETAALKAKLKEAEVEAQGLGTALKAAEADAKAAEATARADREALALRFEGELASAQRKLEEASGREEERAALAAELSSAKAGAEEARVAHAAAMASVRAKLRSAEETAASLRQQMSKDLQEATTKVANRMAYRQQKMEELEEKKRKREARVMAQRYEAEVAELKAKHRAEEESLASQLKTALLEKEMANGDGQRELAQRHMEEIRALRKGFKAEMQLAREAWARKADEAVARLTESKNQELARAKATAAQREMDAAEAAAAELAKERRSFAVKLDEQHDSMNKSSAAMLDRERDMWKGKLAEKEKQLATMASDFEAQLGTFRGELDGEKQRLTEVLKKHQFAIQALKKHHKAELARVHASLAERAEKDIARAKESFQSELSNVSVSYQAEGSELSHQLSELRAEMCEQHRTSRAEAERLSAASAQQAELAATLRSEKDAVQQALQASETRVHDLQLQVERLTQQLAMESQRLTAEGTLVSQRLSSQAELERDALVHKYTLEIQSVQDGLRQAEARLRTSQHEAEQHAQQQLAENNELQARLAEAQANAQAEKRALEDKVEELQASYSSLEKDYSEVAVEKGLLLGANKNLKERLGQMTAAVEENKAAVRAQRAEAEAAVQGELEAVRSAAAARTAELEARIAELQSAQSQAAAVQEAEAQRHGAALVIQRGFRRSKMSSLLSAKSRTEEELAAAQRKADELEVHRFRLEAQRVAGMALTGRQLLQQTSGEAERTMNDILTAFLVPKKDLERFQQLSRSKEALTRSGHGMPPRPKMTAAALSAHTRRHSGSAGAPERRPSTASSQASSALSPLPVAASQELQPTGTIDVQHVRRSAEFPRYNVRASADGGVPGRSGALTAR